MNLLKLKKLAIKRATKKRNGIFEAVAIIGAVILMLLAMVAISQIIVAMGGGMAVDLLTDMPTFFEWKDGILVTETVSDGLISYQVPKTTKFIQVYEIVLWLTVAIGAVSGMVAFASWILEDFDLVPKGEAIKKFFHLLFFIPIAIVFPFIWDFLAIMIENTSIFLMNPFNPDDPAYYAHILFIKAGGIFQYDDAFSIANWGVAFSDPRNFVEGILVNILVAAFKGFMVIQLIIYMLFFAAIREFMTFVLAMLFPFIWILRTIEFTKSIGDLLFSSLVGLTIAPLLSAMIILLGGIEISENIDPPLEEWGSSVAALFLAIAIPVMLSPITGFVAIAGTQMLQSTLSAAAGAGMAVATGGASAAAQMGSSGAQGMQGMGNAAGGMGKMLSNIPELNAGMGKTQGFSLGNVGAVSKGGMGKMDMAKHMIAGMATAGAESMVRNVGGPMGMKGVNRDFANAGKMSQNPTNIMNQDIAQSNNDFMADPNSHSMYR